MSDKIKVCPICGQRVLSTGECINLKCEVVGYSFEDDLGSQVTNNIWAADKAVSKLNLDCKPVFYILGGVALYLHNLNYKYTVDIDTANRMAEDVKVAIGDLLDDAASEVAILPCNYKVRAIRVKEHLQNIEVYVLSKEDLVFTKLLTCRKKDLDAITETGLLDGVSYESLIMIASTELKSDIQSSVTREINKLLEMQCFEQTA